MYYIYILRCSDQTLYIGQTQNVPKRVHHDNTGRGPQYTATRIPVTLAYQEAFSHRSAAMKRERQLKGWSHKKKEALIRSDLDRLKALAKRRSG